jgi:hypothetical protein
MQFPSISVKILLSTSLADRVTILCDTRDRWTIHVCVLDVEDTLTLNHRWTTTILIRLAANETPDMFKPWMTIVLLTV